MEGSAHRAVFVLVLALGASIRAESGSIQAQRHAGKAVACTFDHTMLHTDAARCRPRALSYPPGVDDSVRRAIYDAALTFGVPYPTLLELATCESGLSPRAENGNHYGLFQFLRGTFRAGARRMRRETGIRAGSIWNPRDASYVAGYLFATGKAVPSWRACLSGTTA
jgi:hypothetical protein